MKLIKLNENEFSYLFSSDYIPENIMNMLKKSTSKSNKKHLLEIKEEDADLLRSIWGATSNTRF